MRGGNLLERLLRHGQHAAGAAGAVVEQIGARLDLVRHGQEHEAGHELHGISRRPVLPGFLVVVLIEHAHEVLEDGAHAVIVQTGQLTHGVRAEVDVLAEEFLDELAEAVGLHQLADLVPKLEVLDDVLHVRREAVEVGDEVVLQRLLRLAGL